MEKQFVSSFAGSADYIVNGVKYSVRTWADAKGAWAAAYLPTVLAEVGTVRATHHPEFTEFPSAEVMELFPGYIAARINPEKDYRVEYNGSAPVTFVNRYGWIEVAL